MPTHFICMTCGAQFHASESPPSACPVCEDERQYLKLTGQQWTTLDQLRKSNRISLKQEEPDLISLGVEPHFAIGQRAFLIRTASGNVLWDCLSLLDPALIELITVWGGISAIAISHPHYYGSMVEWSRAFQDAPIYLHAADRKWVMRPDRSLIFWEGESRSLLEGLTLIRCGGHFPGASVLHWKSGASGKGALLTGDVIQVVADRKHVSFMYSYPNYIPLSPSAIDRIVRSVEPLNYDRIYGAFWDMTIEHNAKSVVRQSAARYIAAITNHDP